MKLINNIDLYNYKHSLEYTGLEQHRLTAGVDIKKMSTVFVQDLPIFNKRFEDNADFWLLAAFAQDAKSFQSGL